MNYEETIMEIIINGGNARSLCLKAVRSARSGNLDEAGELFQQAEESLLKAHKVQTELIQAEVRGETTAVTLLLVHAQDHLMNAITVKDLALEMIEEIKIRLKMSGN